MIFLQYCLQCKEEKKDICSYITIVDIVINCVSSSTIILHILYNQMSYITYLGFHIFCRVLKKYTLFNFQKNYNDI